jgi:alpha/beta superfamily hydrolase
MAAPFPEKLFFLPTPHTRLAAVLHPAPSKSLVILCHGFTGTKSESGRLFIQAARAFQRAGLNALRFDFWGSGDSPGRFNEMTPNTQIRDALAVLAWGRRRYKKIAFLGLSLGGGTVICASYLAKRRPDALLTWSSLPGFKWWRTQPDQAFVRGDEIHVGRRFFTDRPKVDVPEAFVALDLPRMQIQGDRDLPDFMQRFASFCPKKDPFARHLIIPGADHTFNEWSHRQRVMVESTRFLKKHLC